MYNAGDRVKMKDTNIRSTPEFLGEYGTVMEPRDHMDRHAPRMEFTKVKFDKRVRNRGWWWVPNEDLEPLYVAPTWEV